MNAYRVVWYPNHKSAKQRSVKIKAENAIEANKAVCVRYGWIPARSYMVDSETNGKRSCELYASRSSGNGRLLLAKMIDE